MCIKEFHSGIVYICFKINITLRVMKSNNILYDFKQSEKRIEEIFNTSYEEQIHVPLRDSLNDESGFYVNVSSIFVDVRDSISLNHEYPREILSKIYKSFVSEVVAIMNGDMYCQEINLISTSICGIFETSSDDSYASLVDTALRINGIARLINSKIDGDIRVGIGVDYGCALMTKVGDEIVYAGDVINRAGELSKNACYLFNKPIAISERIYKMLCQRRADLFLKNPSQDFYECDEIFHDMDI